MNTADMNEILAFACAAAESGFERVMIDPNDAIEIIDQRNELLSALEFISGCQNWDQSTGEASQALYEAASMARTAIAKARGDA